MAQAPAWHPSNVEWIWTFRSPSALFSRELSDNVTKRECTHLEWINLNLDGCMIYLEPNALLIMAAGYEDGNDATSLRHDVVFRLALG